MFKATVRRYSVKSLPLELKPKNKFNAVRSAFNIKPVPSQGLIHNPPAAMPSFKQTPKLFLPANDPRLTILADTYRVYSQEELDEMPVIHGAKKDYDLTPEIINEVVKLRQDDPETWTIAKLAARFNVDARKINVISGDSAVKTAKLRQQLEIEKSTWSAEKTLARSDRVKRKQLWLRNEF